VHEVLGVRLLAAHAFELVHSLLDESSRSYCSAELARHHSAGADSPLGTLEGTFALTRRWWRRRPPVADVSTVRVFALLFVYSCVGCFTGLHNGSRLLPC
jgi:hypothetical protein